MHTPQLHVPLLLQGPLAVAGHTRLASQLHVLPIHPASHVHLPQLHVPCPLQLLVHGTVEQLHAGPLHPTLHWHWSHLHVP